jgi:methanogenic corrinoid protein MtbC1
MTSASLVERYLQPLLAGDRKTCRHFVHGELQRCSETTEVYYNLLWPSMEKVEHLYRADRINRATEHMATRINRSLADQLQAALPQHQSNGKRILISCADDEPEELGAQMCADLFESRGWEVYFVGGGVPNDEILHLVGALRPDLLLIFGTQPTGVPQVRALVDIIRSIGANPTMNIMVSGGVFNRAEGLWLEVHADLHARSAKEAIPLAEAAEPRTPEIRIPGAPKKRRRRRRPPLLNVAPN